MLKSFWSKKASCHLLKTAGRLISCSINSFQRVLQNSFADERKQGIP